MKKSRFYALPIALIGLVVGAAETAHSSYQPPPGTISGRIFFGDQMGNQALGPCSDIKVVATPNKGTPISIAASGPAKGATDGLCTFTLKNIPPSVPIELKAVYGDFSSYAEKTYPLPQGKWTNPITLKAGEKVTKYIEIDGKP